MSLLTIAGKQAIDRFLDIAALDREAWGDAPDARFTPDGEHAWRVWAEYSFVLAVEDVNERKIVGALCGFDTNQDKVHFLHKIFVDPGRIRQGVGNLLLAAYCEYLDTRGLSSNFTTSPLNEAMIAVSDRYGFTTRELIEGYYRPTEDRLLRVRPLTSNN